MAYTWNHLFRMLRGTWDPKGVFTKELIHRLFD